MAKAKKEEVTATPVVEDAIEVTPVASVETDNTPVVPAEVVEPEVKNTTEKVTIIQ